jgi:hypothetical protein
MYENKKEIIPALQWIASKTAINYSKFLSLIAFYFKHFINYLTQKKYNMSFITRFKVDDLKIDEPVLEHGFGLSRDIDHFGELSSIIKGGTIEVLLKASEKTTLFEWMTKHGVHDAVLVHMDPKDPKKELKKFEFKQATVINYEEAFHITGADCVTEKITLSAKSLKSGDGEHVNE